MIMNRKYIFITFAVVLAAGLCANYLASYAAGDRWKYISAVCSLAFFIIWIVLSGDRIADYTRSEYVWYKITGMSEMHIEKHLMCRMLPFICMYVFAVTGTAAFNGWIGACITYVQACLFALNSVCLFFRAKYKGNVAGRIFTVAAYIFMAAVAVMGVAYVAINGFSVQSLNGYLDSKFIKMGIGCLITGNAYALAVNVFIAFLLYKTTASYDDSVCDSQRTLSVMNFKKINFALTGMVGRNISLILSDAKALSLLIFIYAAYLLAGAALAGTSTAYMVFTSFIIILISMEAEMFYRMDIYNRQWYRVLGENYYGLTGKKIMATFCLVLPVVATYLIESAIHLNISTNIIIVLIVSIFSTTMWNVYMAFIYLKMQRQYVRFEIIKICGMFLIMVSPVAIPVTIYMYAKGKKKWSRYVND